jgi:hypothetical protein
LLGAIANALGDDGDVNQRRVQAVEDQNIRNWEAQLRPQFQQLLYGELAFLRRVCKPDAKTFAEVAKAAKAGLQAPLRQFILARYMRRQATLPGANAADPRTAIQDLLLPLAKEKLSPEKVQLYLQECDKRTEARKHTVVVNLVATLDERLVLTTQQRAKLVQSLSANYENSWDQYFEVFGFNGQNFLPSIRDESIVSLLDEQQKTVWGQTVKQSGMYLSGQIIRDFMPGGTTELQEIARIAEEGQNDR